MFNDVRVVTHELELALLWKVIFSRFLLIDAVSWIALTTETAIASVIIVTKWVDAVVCLAQDRKPEVECSTSIDFIRSIIWNNHKYRN